MRILLITTLAACLSSASYAQSEWERPTAPQEAKSQQREKAELPKAANEADMKYLEKVYKVVPLVAVARITGMGST